MARRQRSNGRREVRRQAATEQGISGRVRASGIAAGAARPRQADRGRTRPVSGRRPRHRPVPRRRNIQRRGPARPGRGAVERLADGFREGAFSYLLVLRLVPLFPFFVVNLAPAFLGVCLRT
jgi:hypothetical protein